MESIVINPRDQDEARLIIAILAKMNISSKIISDEEQEDLGLLLMMKEADLNDKVGRDEIMKKLAS